MNKRILIATALELEFKAVKAFLTGRQADPDPDPVTGSLYNIGTYSCGNEHYDVLLVETGAGNAKSADEAGRAIRHFKPLYTFFVGIAGGIKDVQLGDVVASSKVMGYEIGKDKIEFMPRGDSMPASYFLEQVAKEVKRAGTWQERIPALSALPTAFVAPIAAGEKVVGSVASVVYSYLKKYYSDAIAVDMEGIGFLLSARPLHVHAIEVRGISDLIENKEQSDASGSQPVAAAHAAAFTFAMIDLLHLYTPPASQPDHKVRINLSDLNSEGLQVEVREIRERIKQRNYNGIEFDIPQYAELKRELAALTGELDQAQRQRQFELRTALEHFTLFGTDPETVLEDGTFTAITSLYSEGRSMVQTEEELATVILNTYGFLTKTRPYDPRESFSFSVFTSDARYSFSFSVTHALVDYLLEKFDYSSRDYLTREAGMNLYDIPREYLLGRVFPKMLQEYLRLKYSMKVPVDMESYFDFGSWRIGLA